MNQIGQTNHPRCIHKTWPELTNNYQQCQSLSVWNVRPAVIAHTEPTHTHTLKEHTRVLYYAQWNRWPIFWLTCEFPTYAQLLFTFRIVILAFIFLDVQLIFYIYIYGATLVIAPEMHMFQIYANWYLIAANVFIFYIDMRVAQWGIIV